jgi:hypothetical protein
MIRRIGLGALVFAFGIAVAGCGGSDKAASTTTVKPTTTITTTTGAPTTTLSPKQTAANAYFGIVSVMNPAGDVIYKKYYPTAKSTLSLAKQPQYCAENAAFEQTGIDKLNAVTWPPEVQAQATDLIAKDAVLANLYNECAHAPGTLSGQAGYGASISKASDDVQAAASAFRAVLGLPIAH